MIIELLNIGETNARTSQELAIALNINTRDVMQAIRTERLNGLLICGTSKGYFLPENENDIIYTIKRLKKQGNETIRVANAMQERVNNGK